MQLNLCTFSGDMSITYTFWKRCVGMNWYDSSKSKTQKEFQCIHIYVITQAYIHLYSPINKPIHIYIVCIQMRRVPSKPETAFPSGGSFRSIHAPRVWPHIASWRHIRSLVACTHPGRIYAAWKHIRSQLIHRRKGSALKL